MKGNLLLVFHFDFLFVQMHFDSLTTPYVPFPNYCCDFWNFSIEKKFWENNTFYFDPKTKHNQTLYFGLPYSENLPQLILNWAQYNFSEPQWVYKTGSKMMRLIRNTVIVLKFSINSEYTTHNKIIQTTYSELIPIPITITNTDLQTNIIERIIISAMIPGTPSMSAHLRSSPLHDRVSLSNGSD